MPVLCTRAADIIGAKKRSWILSVTTVVALASGLLGASCSAVPSAAPLAADPDVVVPKARYSSVTAPYTPSRPVDPLPWRERNDRVAPQAQP
jgi:hypothetical protein